MDTLGLAPGEVWASKDKFLAMQLDLYYRSYSLIAPVIAFLDAVPPNPSH
jgi:hypothetical protein